MERRPPPKPVARDQAASASGRAPEQTHREPAYLKELIEKKIRVVVRMRDNEEFAGTLEYYDKTFIRLTRGEEPNLFIFKHDIKYLYEIPGQAGARTEAKPEAEGTENSDPAPDEDEEEASEEDAA